jgi:DNA (cytosine-5)-methyltransferase 1
MRTIELFSGCGGAHRGLLAAGCESLLMVERAPAAVQSLMANGYGPVWATDINTLCFSRWHGVVDLLWASPPCQPYSEAGSELGADDSRDCWPATLRAIKESQPQWVVIENVRRAPGEQWCKQLRELGYVADCRILDCKDYGVPQRRKRLFVVAGPKRFRWPTPTHCAPTDSLMMAIGMPVQVTSSAALGQPVYCFATQPEGADSVSQRRIRDLSDRPCVCLGIYRGTGQGGHPWVLGDDGQPTPLTLSQLKILQTFPREHIITGNQTQQRTQIGNAVPPIMAELLASAIRSQACRSVSPSL